MRQLHQGSLQQQSTREGVLSQNLGVSSILWKKKKVTTLIGETQGPSHAGAIHNYLLVIIIFNYYYYYHYYYHYYYY